MSGVGFFLGTAITTWGVIGTLIGSEQNNWTLLLGIALTSSFGLIALNATIGHYVFIIHGQIRQKMLVETVEI